MQVSHVDKNMVEQSSPTIYKEYLKHTLGLTLVTPGLVIFSFPTRFPIGLIPI